MLIRHVAPWGLFLSRRKLVVHTGPLTVPNPLNQTSPNLQLGQTHLLVPTLRLQPACLGPLVCPSPPDNLS